MDEDNCVWIVDKVKLEPELIVDTDNSLTETSSCNPKATLMEDELIDPDKIDHSVGGSSLSDELTPSVRQNVAVKEEILEEGTLSTGSCMDKPHQNRSNSPEHLENDILVQRIAPPHLAFTKTNTEIRHKSMSCSSTDISAGTECRTELSLGSRAGGVILNSLAENEVHPTSSHADQRTLSEPDVSIKTAVQNFLGNHFLSSLVAAELARAPSKQSSQQQKLPHNSEEHAVMKTFSCKRCYAGFKTKAELKSHSLVHSDDNNFSREECPQTSKRKKGLQLHTISHQIDKPFSCDQCPYTCRLKKELQRHKISHSDYKPFICTQCPFACKRKRDLQLHTQSHSDAKPFICTECPYTSKRRGDLQRHMLLHTNEKPFSCDQCSSHFKLRHELTRHSLVHSDVKPFSCNQCSAMFKKRSDLKSHSLVHSNDKPFSCGQCPYTCKRKKELHQHMLSHLRKKPFCCAECPIRFKTKPELEQHVLVHSKPSDKPSDCE